MFGTIRKHQKWLWLVIIIFTIIAFVIFFTPTGQNPLAGGGSANYGLVNSEVIDEGRFQDARKEIILRFRFTYGDWPNNREMLDLLNFNLQRETYFRILLSEKIAEHGIQVSDKTAADLARAMFAQTGTSYQQFIELLKNNPGLGITARDFDRFVRNEAGITQLISLIGLGGRLVTDEEAEDLYQFENQQISAQAVFFNFSNHLDAVTVDEAALGTFFTNRMASYRIPERVQVRYVRFDSTNHLDKADELLGNMTNLNDIVETMFLSDQTNYFNRGAKTEDEAHAMIRDDLRERFALLEARRRAVEFDDYLLDLDAPKTSEFDRMAEEENLTVHTTTPFTRDYGPEDIDVPPDFARVAFRLSAEQPFGELVEDEESVYVLAFDKRLPSEVPPLAEVREEVIADYRRSQALAAAQQEGSQFLASVTNGLASGKTFADICSENGRTSVSLPLFSARTQSLPEVENQIRLEVLKDVALRTPPGEASPFIPTSTGGMILYVDSRQPVDEEKMRDELPRFAQYVRQARQNSLFQGWIQQQLATGYLQIPQEVLGQPQNTVQ